MDPRCIQRTRDWNSSLRDVPVSPGARANLDRVHSAVGSGMARLASKETKLVHSGSLFNLQPPRLPVLHLNTLNSEISSRACWKRDICRKLSEIDFRTCDKIATIMEVAARAVFHVLLGRNVPRQKSSGMRRSDIGDRLRRVCLGSD